MSNKLYNFLKQYEELFVKLFNLDKYKNKIKLCHNDIQELNILIDKNKKIYLID